MKPTTLTSMALVAAAQFLGALAASPTAASAAPTQSPSTLPVPDQLTSHGCYSSGANLTEQSGVASVSSGKCYDVCKNDGYYVSGLRGSKCYCGMVYPPSADLDDDDACNYPCPGYGLEACGSIEGSGHWSIFNTGIEIDVADYEPEVSSTASPSSTQATSQTSAAETVIATETSGSGESGNEGDKKKSGPNTAAIAAGVVVGVVVMGAVVGGLLFFVRRRRNAEIEEEHRRNAAVNAFINGSKPPGSSGSISMTDSRLDPVMAHRRLSDGSIADNQDYSRRILRVTNA